MKRIILMPDSFKGSYSSSEICSIMEKAIHDILPDCETISIPVADGGEGSVDCFLRSIGGEKIFVNVTGPKGEKMKAYYGYFKDFAVIEMAACAGLPLMGDNKDPLYSTTYGVGELMIHALNKHCKKLIIGVGGSATNDGGCGMAAAIGVKFYDTNGRLFIPTGGTLKNITKIDMSDINPLIKNADITAMCDIVNPLFGKNGAAYIFGPQKGADEITVKFLDEGLTHLHKIMLSSTGIDMSSISGGGAGGGMGAGLYGFANAILSPGIDTVLETVNFNTLSKETNLIITGEGRLDSQTLNGKVACGVGRAAKKLGIPAIAIVGSIEKGLTDFSDMGLTAVFDTVTSPMTLEEAILNTKTNITLMTKNAIRIITETKCQA